MKNLLLIFSFLFISPVSASCELPVFSPASVKLLHFNAQDEKIFEENQQAAMKVMQRLEGGMEYEGLSEAEKEALDKVDESWGSYWDILPAGCSWYCGGGPSKVNGSGFLGSQGANDYAPANAHDLSYQTAWVEGSKGHGIGEYLLYTFSGSAPRINEIIVVNGYVKSQKAWQDNARVRKLKVSLNEEPLMILHLEDSRSEQRFEVAPLGHSNRGPGLENLPSWTLKFEILEVYPGLRYDDVAITEIYFDGLDVHCFAAGTRVLMADHTTRNIEDLIPGDTILTFDEAAHQLVTARIQKLDSALHHDLASYVFENGTRITATPDHPFLLQSKGWASLDPEGSAQYHGFENISTIQTGDAFRMVKNGQVSTTRLQKIIPSEEEQLTYTISLISRGNSFIVNGMVAGVETLQPEHQIRKTLEAFSQGYQQRDTSRAEQWFDALFFPDAEIIGTYSVAPDTREWESGRASSLALFIRDWSRWGDLAVEAEKARIDFQGDWAWVSMPATLTRAPGNSASRTASESFQAMLSSFEEMLLEQDSTTTPAQKIQEMAYFSNLLMYQYGQGDTFIWPLRISAVLQKENNHWKFRQMHFSYPNRGFPNVRYPAF